MRHLQYFLWLFLVFVLSSCTNSTTVRHRADYDSIMLRSKEVLILSPQAEVAMVDISNHKERMYDYEYHLEDLIASTVITAVQEKGFRVKLLRKKDIQDRGLYDDYMHLRSSYDLIREELYIPLWWEEKKAFNITARVNAAAAANLGEKTNSDIILMIDYVGAVKTNGARTRDFVMSILLNSSATNGADKSAIIIGMIAARTGNILWTNIISDSKDLYSCAMDNLSSQEKVEQERLNWLIMLVLRPLIKE